jgi:protein SCO1/2
MNPVTAPAEKPGAMPARRRIPWMGIVATAAMLCAALALWLKPAGDGSTYQYYGQWIGKDAPDFTLTDQDGQSLRMSDLRGKLVLMTFGFTHCPNICPTTLANLAAIYQALPAQEQQRVQVLFVTVDPARDTPQALKEYVQFYAKGFTGLTGSTDDIAKVAKEYGASFEAVPQESQVAGDYYTVNHSTYVYLIDPAGRFAVLYDNDKLVDHARMGDDIAHLLAGAGQ